MSKKVNEEIAVNLYINDLKHQKMELMRHQNELGQQIVNLNQKISKLENLSEDDKKTFLDINIKFFPEIPTKIKTLLTNYAKTHLHQNSITAEEVFKLGKRNVQSIYGIGKWFIIDLDIFFELKGYDWKD